MKRLVVLFFLTTSIVNADDIGSFTVDSVGASNNTNSVYVETTEMISGTTCSNKKVFRLPDTDKQADRFFSLALAAQAQGKKITIAYNVNECHQTGTLVKVFKMYR